MLRRNQAGSEARQAAGITSIAAADVLTLTSFMRHLVAFNETLMASGDGGDSSCL